MCNSGMILGSSMGATEGRLSGEVGEVSLEDSWFRTLDQVLDKCCEHTGEV